MTLQIDFEDPKFSVQDVPFVDLTKAYLMGVAEALYRIDESELDGDLKETIPSLVAQISTLDLEFNEVVKTLTNTEVRCMTEMFLRELLNRDIRRERLQREAKEATQKES